MRLTLILALLVLSGCATSVCVDNLNITEQEFIQFPDRPNLARSSVVFDKTISYGAEPHVLRGHQINQTTYYVAFYPTRAQSRLYGPYQGNFSDVIRCKQ